MVENSENLPNDPEKLKAIICSKDIELESRDSKLKIKDDELKNHKIKIEKLEHQISMLVRARFGSSSESAEQLGLDLERNEVAEPSATESQTPSAEPRKKVKRVIEPLPAHLPRETVVLEPVEGCAECTKGRKRLRVDVTEALKVIPSRLVVIRFERPCYECRECGKFLQAPAPSRPLRRGRTTASLLAHVIVSKYADHLPLARQTQMFAREGVKFSRKTMCDWVLASTSLMKPVYDELARRAREGPTLHADETTVKLLEKNLLPKEKQESEEKLTPEEKKALRKRGRWTAYLWTYVRDQRGWAGPDPPVAWYRFALGRGRENPDEHLKDYKGFVHVDGYQGYNKLFEREDVTEVACLAHIRRRFSDVKKSMPSPIAKEALERIAKLYAVEKKARGLPASKRAALRQDEASDEFKDLEEWLECRMKEISAKSTLGKAVNHAIERLPTVRPYLKNGRLELDNNAVERSIRPVAIGRKNWLFAGSEGGGEALAIAMTLIETAKMNDVNPQEWIAWLLQRIADRKDGDIDELMPWNFKNATE